MVKIDSKRDGMNSSAPGLPKRDAHRGSWIGSIIGKLRRVDCALIEGENPYSILVPSRCMHRRQHMNFRQRWAIGFSFLAGSSTSQKEAVSDEVQRVERTFARDPHTYSDDDR